MLMVLCAALGQVCALDLQRLVVIDDSPHEGSGIGLALAEVNCALCREVSAGKFFFIFGNRNIGLLLRRGNRKARPTGWSLFGRDLEIHGRRR